jgi:hypothetical protein
VNEILKGCCVVTDKQTINTEKDLRETGWGGMDWIDLAQNRHQWRARYSDSLKRKMEELSNTFRSVLTFLCYASGTSRILSPAILNPLVGSHISFVP